MKSEAPAVPNGTKSPFASIVTTWPSCTLFWGELNSTLNLSSSSCIANLDWSKSTATLSPKKAEASSPAIKGLPESDTSKKATSATPATPKELPE